MRWDIEMQVQFLLEERSNDFAVLYGQMEVHKVNLGDAVTEIPNEATGFVHGGLECVPLLLIFLLGVESAGR